MLPRSVVTLSSDGDLGIRAVDKDNKVVFFPIDLVDDTPNGLVLAGIPADARVIVAGQDLVSEGDEVKPVEADAATIQKLIGQDDRRNLSRKRRKLRHGYRQASDRNARLTLSVLVFLVIAGALAYRAVPKEAEPDVAIPIMYVSLVYQGISPEDAERLLLRPVESQLKSLKGLKEMKSNAYQGGANVIVEFDPVRRSWRCADRYAQQGAGRQARPAGRRRGADRQRGQPFRISGRLRHAFRRHSRNER